MLSASISENVHEASVHKCAQFHAFIIKCTFSLLSRSTTCHPDSKILGKLSCSMMLTYRTYDNKHTCDFHIFSLLNIMPYLMMKRWMHSRFVKNTLDWISQLDQCWLMLIQYHILHTSVISSCPDNVWSVIWRDWNGFPLDKFGHVCLHATK